MATENGTFSYKPTTSGIYTWSFRMKNSGTVAQPASVYYLDNLQVSYPYPYTRIDCDKGPNASYRFGFNKQEKVDEIAGAGNHTTAKYWEYDTRLGRRWNLDPIYNTDISRYAINGNNPIYYLDPNGDYKTKFGAKVANFIHGGDGVSQNTNKDSKHYGEWSYGKNTNHTNEKGELVVNPYDHYGKQGGEKIENIADNSANTINKSTEYLKNNASNIWNSPMARSIIPDYYTLSRSFQTSSGLYASGELTLTLMVRGKDPGLYFNSTTGFGGVSSIGVDVGCSVGKGYYIGDARNLSSSMLGGWQGSGFVGVGLKAIAGVSINGGVDVGFDDNGKPTTATGKVGISVGVGVSTPVLQVGGGAGKATNAIPLLKF